MADLRLPYSKPTSSLGDLLRHWESQGLLVTDRNMAEHHLRFIGYYRLRGYAHHFQQIATNATGVRLHQFRRGSTFENIFDLYCLDRGLRSSLTAMLERIEVGVRTVISEKASIAYGPHWFLSKIAFADDAHHQATDQIFRKILNERESARRHNFLAHYRKTYSAPEIPPSWMMFELLSFGNISHIYAGLSSRLKKDIAANFDISPETLTSWIWALSCLRNLCAIIVASGIEVLPSSQNKIRNCVPTLLRARSHCTFL